jgi:hypothetical protein
LHGHQACGEEGGEGNRYEHAFHGCPPAFSLPLVLAGAGGTSVLDAGAGVAGWPNWMAGRVTCPALLPDAGAAEEAAGAGAMAACCAAAAAA